MNLMLRFHTISTHCGRTTWLESTNIEWKGCKILFLSGTLDIRLLVCSHARPSVCSTVASGPRSLCRYFSLTTHTTFYKCVLYDSIGQYRPSDLWVFHLKMKMDRAVGNGPSCNADVTVMRCCLLILSQSHCQAIVHKSIALWRREDS